MKREALLKHLRAHGAEFCREGGSREGGSHEVWRKGKAISAIPRHREIKPNTGRKICKDLGIPPMTGK